MCTHYPSFLTLKEILGSNWPREKKREEEGKRQEEEEREGEEGEEGREGRRERVGREGGGNKCI